MDEQDNRCIFCEADASASRSREHLVPESLGNKSHTLAPGMVCDKCNQYFAVKIEKPLLEHPAIRNFRFHHDLPGKRGTVPVAHARESKLHVPVHLLKSALGTHAVFQHPTDAMAAMCVWKRNGRGIFEYNIHGDPDRHLLGRFMAKFAIEALALKFCSHNGWRGQILRDELLPLRRHARFAERPQVWPIHHRRIYSADTRFPSATGEFEQVVFEFDLLYSDKSHMFAVLCLFGLELVIDLVNPSTEAYEDWLRRHHGVSPLYSKVGRFDVATL